MTSMHIFTYRQEATGNSTESVEISTAEADAKNFQPENFLTSIFIHHKEYLWIFGTDDRADEKFREFGLQIDAGVLKIYAYDDELLEVFAAGAWSQLHSSRYVTEILR